MKVEDLKQDELLKVVSELIRMEKVTVKDVEMLLNIVPQETKKLAESLHAVFCHEVHDLGKCEWYQDHSLDVAWQKPSHVKWIEIALRFEEEYGLSLLSFKTALLVQNQVAIILNDARLSEKENAFIHRFLQYEGGRYIMGIMETIRPIELVLSQAEQTDSSLTESPDQKD